MLRLVHFSDAHLTSRRLGWRARDLFTKKPTGWINVRLLGRGHRFRHAPEVVDALARDIRERGAQHRIFSGDATKLAFDSEFAIAADKLGVHDPSLPPAIAVPGNHDYYTKPAFRAELFEKHFAPWLIGERIGEHRYPFAQKVGHAWLIAVNSSTANWATWDASGRIGREQLARLETLCSRLDSGPRIVVTHYPLRTASGRIEPLTHRLRDHADAIATARRCDIRLWLHGHIHRGYVLEPSDVIPFTVICAGSCTQTNRWMYNEYQLDDLELTIQQRVYSEERKTFLDGTLRTLSLDRSSSIAARPLPLRTD